MSSVCGAWSSYLARMDNQAYWHMQNCRRFSFHPTYCYACMRYLTLEVEKTLEMQTNKDTLVVKHCIPKLNLYQMVTQDINNKKTPICDCSRSNQTR